METLVKNKADLRKQKKVILKSMDSDDKARLDMMVCEQLKTLSLAADAEYVYAYMALSWETGTEEILSWLWKRQIKVAFPRVIGKEMEFFEVRSKEDLEEGAFHILEPKADCPRVEWPKAVILVPGLAFTREGKRLGKGGGYYDKYLDRYPHHRTVALAYDFQIVEDFPIAEHDRMVDVLVTESGITKCNADV